MTSLKQIAANRKNALKSTGPITAQGKARVSRNALRHGLSISANRASVGSADVEELALLLVGDAASRTEIDLARAVVAAQLDLDRIHCEKQLVLTSGVSPPEIKAIRLLDRYERRAKSRRKRALSELSRLCQLPIFR
jgi:hypothetical protein